MGAAFTPSIDTCFSFLIFFAFMSLNAKKNVSVTLGSAFFAARHGAQLFC